MAQLYGFVAHKVIGDLVSKGELIGLDRSSLEDHHVVRYSKNCVLDFSLYFKDV